MSAYSRLDIEEAFACVAETAEIMPPTLTVEDTRERLLDHLNSNCECDRNRCRHCGLRPRNKVPNHKPDCPMALRKK